MRLRTMLAGVSVLALVAAGYQYFGREQGIGVPPRISPTGETNDDGWIVRRKTVDYEAITRSALMKQASFLTLTLAQDVVRNRHLETEIRYRNLQPQGVTDITADSGRRRAKPP